MDNLDLKAIYKLMHNARATWAELGAYLGLSAPAAAERVHKLEQQGIIRGYTALIEANRVGLNLAALVSVTLERPEHRQEFLQFVGATPEIQECHHTAGDEDYILKVCCKDTRHLEKLLSHDIKGICGVIKTRTTVILSTVKETPVLPLVIE
ncbi:Lrp/AsnC family transcriptional regulator [Sporomusa aerivorans]|uniref:Lrp/AsnC family transcriptional regulator n=1 Tax=Sporomusa aerivorans TaxID=204936 RepID=UPI003529FB05